MNVADGSVPSWAVEAARAGDLTGIRWLLDLEALPSADLSETALEHFLVVRDEIGVVGVVGLEVYGKVALLRSLVVANSHAGRGIGRGLVAAAESLAAMLGCCSIYLLTTTAEAFFELLGFRRIERRAAPPEIQQTTEFSSLCPSSATVMAKP
jgi:amino-acid N-acetyltransferase